MTRRFCAVSTTAALCSKDPATSVQRRSCLIRGRSEAPALTPGWSEAMRPGRGVTAGGIYFVNRPDPAAPYSLKFLDFTTRKTTELATFGPHSREFLIGSMAVSPDEQTILVAQRHRLEYDLMLVENFR